MFSKSLALRILSAVFILVLLSSCSGPTPTPEATSVPQPTVNVQATLIGVQTQAVQTFTANLTQNAPTATKVAPTKPPQPTATQVPPSATPAKPAGTATPTQKPQPVGPTATLPIFCSVSSFLINDGSDPITAGDTFKITWVVVNTGSTAWTAPGFSVMYWSGVRFANQQRLDLPFEVGPGANITMPVEGLKAPSNAGTYRAVWAIIKGFTPYCLMPVTVVVK